MVHLLFKSGFFLIPVLALAQTAVPVLPESSQVERLGLIGVLFAFCVVLARKCDQLITSRDLALAEKDKQRDAEITRKEIQLAAKDEHLLEMTRQMNQSLTLQIESNRRVEAVVAESARAKEELTGAIKMLAARIGRLPCTEVLEEKG